MSIHTALQLSPRTSAYMDAQDGAEVRAAKLAEVKVPAPSEGPNWTGVTSEDRKMHVDLRWTDSRAWSSPRPHSELRHSPSVWIETSLAK